MVRYNTIRSNRSLRIQLSVTVYRNTDDLQTDVQKIIEDAQKMAYQSVNVVLLQRNWLLGKRIAEEILHEENRAKYGAQVIKKLSKEFTRIFGRGFTRSNLYSFYKFYQLYPEIFNAASDKSQALLSWTHYRILIQEKILRRVPGMNGKLCLKLGACVHYKRNIDTQYYDRLLISGDEKPVIAEMKKKNSSISGREAKFYKKSLYS